MAQKKVLGLIPARGGSKGVLRKNIRPLSNRPLIDYTVEVALEAGSLDRIIVSTDDVEIAKVVERAGAEVPFLRPAEYATDTSSTISVIHHALDWLKKHETYHPDAVALLAPTCPLRTSDQIEASINLLWTSKLDSVVTVFPSPYHPYFIYSLDENSRLKELITMPNKPLRRQELPPYFAHSQAVMVSRTTYIELCDSEMPAINFGSVAGLEIDPKCALDIDTLTDFMVAEMLLENGLVRKTSVC